MVLALLLWPAGAADRPPRELRVFAAASLTDVLAELARDWERSSGVRVRLSFAATSVLARQVEAGGAADVFVSADQEWLDYLAARGLIAPGSRRDLAANQLVLIAPVDSSLRLQLTPGDALAAGLVHALGDGRLAIADPAAVPAGRYARTALTRLGVWDSVSGRLAPAENVRTALQYVARGEAPLGIVYATDVRGEANVRVLAVFPDGSHAPIVYPAAALTGARPESVAWLDFLSGTAARAVWKKHGFREPPR